MVRAIHCWRPPPPPQDEFYRPLLQSIEIARAKKGGPCLKRNQNFKYPCPQCSSGGCLMDGKPAGMAYSNNLCSPGNTTGCCGNGKCASGPRLQGQGPCDPPCFSKFVFPPYPPYVNEPKFQPETSFVHDTCGMSPCGGCPMYGAFTRSCFSCNGCGSCRNSCGINDVSCRPCFGCNNAGCGCGSSGGEGRNNGARGSMSDSCNVGGVNNLY